MTTVFDELTALDPIHRPSDVLPENPLSYGGRWSTIVAGLEINVAEELASVGNPPGVNYSTLVLSLWNPAQFTDFAISAQAHALDSIVMRGRASADGLTNYYEASFNNSDDWYLKKKIGVTTTTLAQNLTGPGFSVFTGLNQPDRFAFRIHGTTIETWHLHGDTDTWTQVLTATDSALAGPGYFVLGLAGASSLLINFNGAGGPGGIRGGNFPPKPLMLAGGYRAST